MEKFFHINIGREIGAGGLELANILGEIFGVKVYDKELVTLAAKESGLDPALFAKADEKNTLSSNNSFSLSSFVEAIQTGFGANYISSGRLFKIQSEVIRKLAEAGSTIFIGRCADYILRDFDNCINVFITANIKDRVERIRKSSRLDDVENLSDEKIIDLLAKGDKQRATYYGNYTFKTWGKASSYDICLNSSLIPLEECAKIVEQQVNKILNR